MKPISKLFRWAQCPKCDQVQKLSVELNGGGYSVLRCSFCTVGNDCDDPYEFDARGYVVVPTANDMTNFYKQRENV